MLIPGRHLGLVTPAEYEEGVELVQKIREIAERHLDIEKIVVLLEGRFDRQLLGELTLRVDWCQHHELLRLEVPLAEFESDAEFNSSDQNATTAEQMVDGMLLSASALAKAMFTRCDRPSTQAITSSCSARLRSTHSAAVCANRARASASASARASASRRAGCGRPVRPGRGPSGAAARVEPGLVAPATG